MTVTVYRSTDASAPVFNPATPGSWNDVLKACLETGYGSKAGSGWTTPFDDTASKTRVFRQGGGGMKYLQVIDSDVSGSEFTSMRGYESMTAHNAGVGAFPTTIQVPNSGVCIRTGSTQPVQTWTIVATDKCFYACVEKTSVAGQYPGSFFFGDRSATDLWSTSIVVGRVSNPWTSSPLHYINTSLNSGDIPGSYTVRKYDGSGGSFGFNRFPDGSFQSGTVIGNGTLPYPNRTDGGLYLSPVRVNETVSGELVLRGVMPGLWSPCHVPGWIQHGDTLVGSGDYAGKTFEAWGSDDVSSTRPVLLIETSNTW